MEADDTGMIGDAVGIVLESVMTSYRVRAEIITRVRFCGPWAAQAPRTAYGLFHMMTEGECAIRVPDLETPIWIRTGDLIVFPTGSQHSLEAPLLHEPTGLQPARENWMLCGKLEFLNASRNPIFSALPVCFVVRADTSSKPFRQIAKLLSDTAAKAEWGHQLLQNKLADSLFTMAVCEYVRASTNARGLLAGLADQRLCKALAAIHSRPGEDWSIQTMAKVAGMSRSAFARVFHQILGQPPMQYLSEWRGAEARRLLRDRKLSVATVSGLLGYRSEAAFRRFFKRVEGVGPGSIRSANAMQTA